MQSSNKTIDFLLEHNSNLLNHQCCRVIQDPQSNLQSVMDTDVTENLCTNQLLQKVWLNNRT